MFMEKYIIVSTLPHQPIRDKELGHYEPFRWAKRKRNCFGSFWGYDSNLAQNLHPDYCVFPVPVQLSQA